MTRGGWATMGPIPGMSPTPPDGPGINQESYDG